MKAKIISIEDPSVLGGLLAISPIGIFTGRIVTLTFKCKHCNSKSSKQYDEDKGRIKCPICKQISSVEY